MSISNPFVLSQVRTPRKKNSGTCDDTLSEYIPTLFYHQIDEIVFAVHIAGASQ